MFGSTIYRDIFKTHNFNIRNSITNSLPESTIGEKIKKLRYNLGLTQLQFAKQIRKGFSTVTRWEQNITVPNGKNISSIISVFNLSQDYFK